MSLFRYDDDGDSSDDSSSSSDESSTSSSTSDGYQDDPHWMEKFNLSRSNHDKMKARTNGSRKKPSVSTDWMKKFEQNQYQQSALSSSAYGRNAKSSLSLPTQNSKQDLNIIRRKSADEANEINRASRETIHFHKQSSSRSIDKAKRRERIRQNLERLRRRKSKREKRLKAQREQNGLSKDPPVMSTKTKNDQKLVARDTKAQHDGSMPSDKKNNGIRRSSRTATNQDMMKGIPAGNISKKQREQDRLPSDSSSTRARNPKKPSIRNMDTENDRKISSEQTSNGIFQGSRRTKITPAQENYIDQTRNDFPNKNLKADKQTIKPLKENMISKWSKKQTPTENISSTADRNVPNSISHDKYLTGNQKVAQKRIKEYEEKQQADKTSNVKDVNIVQSSKSSAQRDAIKLPSIGPKLNSFRKAIRRNSTNGNTISHPTPKHFPTQSHHAKPLSAWKKSSTLTARHGNESSNFKYDVPGKQIMAKESPLLSKPTSTIVALGEGVPKDDPSTKESVDNNSTSLSVKDRAPTTVVKTVDGHSKDTILEKETVGTKDCSNLGEIETKAPKNLFGMWGATVKAKKPTVNASMMSARMIRNQADKIKQRIERARKEVNHAGSLNNEECISDEKSTCIKLDPDESASALFFGAQGKDSDIENSISLENSAAAMFGFAAKAKENDAQKSRSMDNSAAAMFGFTASQEGREYRQESISMDNSAAAMFGPKVSQTQQEDSNKSISMDNSAAAMFGFAATEKEEKNNQNSISMNNSGAAMFGQREEKNDTQTSISMDNSAAAMFGFAATEKEEKNNQNSISMNNSAAAMFGQREEKNDTQTSISMDNSAAAMFGFAVTEKEEKNNQNSISMNNSAAAMFGQREEKNDTQTSISMDNSAAAMFGFATTKSQQRDIKNEGNSEESEDSTDDSSTDEDAANLFYGVNSAKSTKKSHDSESDTRSADDNSIDQDAAALFYGASFKVTKNNSFDDTKQKSNQLDKEKSLNLGNSELSSGDSIKNEVTNTYLHSEQVSKEVKNQSSISMDNSAAAMFGIKTVENKKRDSPSLDSNPSSFKSTNGAGSSDKETSKRTDTAMAAKPSSTKSWLDDSSSYTSSSDSSIEKKQSKKGPCDSTHSGNNSDIETSKRVDVSVPTKPSSTKSWLEDSSSYTSTSDSSIEAPLDSTNSDSNSDNKTSKRDDVSVPTKPSSTKSWLDDSSSYTSSSDSSIEKKQSKVAQYDSTHSDNNSDNKTSKRDDVSVPTKPSSKKSWLDDSSSYASSSDSSIEKKQSKVAQYDSTHSDNNSDNKTSKNEDVSVPTKPSSKKSWLDDSSSYTSSSDDSVVENKLALSSISRSDKKQRLDVNNSKVDQILGQNPQGDHQRKNVPEKESLLNISDGEGPSSSSESVEGKKPEALSREPSETKLLTDGENSASYSDEISLHNNVKNRPSSEEKEANSLKSDIKKKAGKKKKKHKKTKKKKAKNKKSKKEAKHERKKDKKPKAKDSKKSKSDEANTSNEEPDVSFNEDESCGSSDMSIDVISEDSSIEQKKVKKAKKPKEKKRGLIRRLSSKKFGKK